MDVNEIVKVKYKVVHEARPLRCLENVESHVARHAGELVTGWSVHRKGPIAELAHHCVWRSPNDCNLYNITPNIIDASGEGLTAWQDCEFIDDPTAHFVGKPPNRHSLLSRHVPLRRCDRLSEACELLGISQDKLYGGDPAGGRYYHDKANKILNKYSIRLHMNDTVYVTNHLSQVG